MPLIETRRQVNWWMIYALIQTGLIIVGVVVPQCLTEPGRRKSIQSTNRLLQLAANRDFEGMSAIAAPNVIEFMRERDAKWGKILKYSFDDSVVQIGGTPSWVRYRVWRERKNVQEQFHCNGERIFVGHVTWPEGEEK